MEEEQGEEVVMEEEREISSTESFPVVVAFVERKLEQGRRIE